MKITVKAYAKINLLLDILGTLDNGYHDLFMLMQSVGIYDTVTVETNESGKITLSCDVEDIPTDERNIAYKAALAFFSYTKLTNHGIHISIEKRIPHAAGLAGGSADGAAVVVALRQLFMPQLAERDVIEICSSFGSDVPFCAVGGTMLAQYTGTVLTYLPQLEIKNIIVVKPDCSVSTGAAYKAFDTAERVRHLNRDGILKAALSSDTDKLYDCVGNVFEQFIDVPERAAIKAIMRKYNAKCSCMSGSGPSVFGIFDDEESAKKCTEELKEKFPQTFLCSSKEQGCEVLAYGYDAG
ncbi:MAG: 4-(cytidine 5'-diphospho)-2-C-methyl-D-erythritol kinase [Faecalibacterium sp.]|nr:4-(cytidine 5'-diphospho)-2-C-methyl-D-erythritol kinase [Ruminococcus sp.]MCM1393082.1 4-(cytidine 5'-diphospho)-2-C-methyl-D-erythritol kinase [Ruminococcus sp.]MCM1484808.1 4-(cytidine 5'-diphospho)-2-C-methyl-D-erythritol kinase [Faecalibacterium sp.]